MMLNISAFWRSFFGVYSRHNTVAENRKAEMFPIFKNTSFGGKMDLWKNINYLNETMMNYIALQTYHTNLLPSILAHRHVVWTLTSIQVGTTLTMILYCTGCNLLTVLLKNRFHTRPPPKVNSVTNTCEHEPILERLIPHTNLHIPSKPDFSLTIKSAIKDMIRTTRQCPMQNSFTPRTSNSSNKCPDL